jgi:tRNA-specific 2-thiouridylase
VTAGGPRSRVLVAMSGGVDSSVAAALIKAEGHEAIGVWMRLSDVSDSHSDIERSCCSLDAADDARRVAAQLDIPFYILNLEREFDEGVLQPFLRAYLEGRTPSPCVDCNTVVKFGALLGRARLQYDCDAVATGHYARVSAPDEAAVSAPGAGDAGAAAVSAPGDRTAEAGAATPGHYNLLRGLDPAKDQSYFLYGLGQEELAHTRFPLGSMTKPQVRDIARAMGMGTAEKRDSQEICFVPRGNYRDVLRERAGWTAEPGPLLDVDGRQVGEHAGSASYTVGQRSGTGVALGEPRYVWQIDSAANIVKLGRREDLETRRFEVGEMSFVAGERPGAADEFKADVQIRHRGKPVAATVRLLGGDSWVVETAEPVWAAAPGQAAVFYHGDVVVGGGRIAAGPKSGE